MNQNQKGKAANTQRKIVIQKLINCQKGSGYDPNFAGQKRPSLPSAYWLMQGEKVYVGDAVVRYNSNDYKSIISKWEKKANVKSGEYQLLLLSILTCLGGVAETFSLANMFFMKTRQNNAESFLSAIKTLQNYGFITFCQMAEGREIGNRENVRPLKFVAITRHGALASQLHTNITPGRIFVPRTNWDYKSTDVAASFKARLSNAELISKLLQSGTLTSFTPFVFPFGKKLPESHAAIWLQMKNTPLLLINIRNKPKWKQTMIETINKFEVSAGGRHGINFLILFENYTMTKVAYSYLCKCRMKKTTKILFTDDVSIANGSQRRFIYTIKRDKNNRMIKNVLQTNIKAEEQAAKSAVDFHSSDC